MGNLGIIDQFLAGFIQYIDSGFGLLSGNVAFLTSTLIGIDITLAGLFWCLDGEADIIARLLKKTLYIGAFAFILNDFQTLATAIFDSLSGLGLIAGGGTLTAQTLLQPGQLASTGFQAAWPLIKQAEALIGFSSMFKHAVMIMVLVGAWFIVVLAFFVLAVQLFITILEFKLTTLAGFVLVPFALWNRTSFLAERVLGGVVSAGLKVMVLAVIVGIGSGYFGQFINALNGQEPTLADVASLVLASLALFGLGIFGPGIAAGLVSGAPQLSAAAALGTGAALVGSAALAGGAALGAGRLGLGAIRAGTALGSGTATAYSLGRMNAAGDGAMAGAAAGLGGVARAGGSAAKAGAQAMMRNVFGDSVGAGARAAYRATGGTSAGTASDGGGSSVPAWAKKMRAEQRTRTHAQNTMHAIHSGDRPGAGAHPDLSEREN